jgi:Flp pilus assembly protein TadD
MPEPEILEGIIIAEPVMTNYEDAAKVFEQALQMGRPDPNVAYLLALTHKRLGKNAEARAAFRKVQPPDANVWLQLGLLSLQEKHFAQAEQEFGRSFEMDSRSYEAGYNLALTRLHLGQVEACAALLPRVTELAPSATDQRFLRLLADLLASCPSATAALPPADMPALMALTTMTGADEQRLLQLLRGLDQFETACTLLRSLAAGRPQSLAVQEASFEAALIHGKKLADRGEWGAAARMLGALVRITNESRSLSRPAQTAFYNLLGCCACMEQDFERGIRYFSHAQRLNENDARIAQNLALAYEWNGELDHAEPHWGRFLDLLDGRVPGPPDRPLYQDQLAFETLIHLAEAYSKKERWPAALKFLQQASRIRPQDTELLERLFHLYTQLKRPEDARRTLYRLRQLRPHDPQLDLYELDLRDTKSLDDIDRMLSDIGRILKKYPNDLRVEERAVGMVGNVIPLMGRLCDQLTEQMSRILDQVRRLSNSQINWSAVRDVMRDLEGEFLKLRQITRQCLPLVTNDEHRRIIRELSTHIDRKIEDCRRLGR